MINVNLLLIGVTLVCLILSQNCPLPINQKSQIFASILDISKDMRTSASLPLNYSSYQYMHSYTQSFHRDPVIVFGIINMDTQNTKSIELLIQVKRVSQQSAIFKINPGEKAQWSKLVINILATTREDMQIGFTGIQVAQQGQRDFRITYLTQKQWTQQGKMRIKHFLQGIKIISNNQPTMGLQYLYSDITTSKIVLFYRKNGRNDQVLAVRIGLIIYNEQINGVLYTEGFIEQNIIGQKYTSTIQRNGIESLNTSISGLASMEISTMVPLKFGVMIDNFLNLVIENKGGRSSKLCVSYMILEIQQCGDCGKMTYHLDGQCLQNCPDKYQNQFGMCMPTGCPRNNSSCFRPCKQNQLFEYGKCVCKDGYYVNGICRVCPEGQRYNYRLQQCMNTQCGQNSFFANGECKCFPGFIKLGFNCFPCPKGYYFEENTEKCQPICAPDQLYADKKCICPQGQYKINGICGQCQKNAFFNSAYRICQCNTGFQMRAKQCTPICKYGQKYNDQQRKCVSICPQYQQLVSGICLCKPELEIRNGKCVPCVKNSLYDYNTRRCICIRQHYLINGECLPCPIYSSYDTLKEKCICHEGFKQNSSTRKCDPDCSQYQQFIGGKCQCKDSYYRINGDCQQCSLNQEYHKFKRQCVCKQGYRADPQNPKSCIRFCQGKFEKIQQGQCKCIQGYQRATNGSCRPCETNQIYSSSNFKCNCDQGYQRNSTTNKCQVICKQNQIYKNGLCKCSYNYVEINRKCVECPRNSVYSVERETCICYQNYMYNPQTNICYPDCKQNQVLVYESYNSFGIINAKQQERIQYGSCVCKKNYQRINGYCKSCPPKYSIYDQITQKCNCIDGYKFQQFSNSCLPICKQNQYFFNGTCQCIPNYHRFKPTKECIECPSQSIYDSQNKSCKCFTPLIFNQNLNLCEPNCQQFQEYINAKCVCIREYYQIDGKCQKCHKYSEYNFAQKECQCIDGYRQEYQGLNKYCVKRCKDKQLLVNGECQCIPGFYLIEGYCQPCQQYQAYSKQAGRCLCNAGYINENRRCVKECNRNETRVGNICACIKDHYRIRGSCRPCPANSFYNPSRQQCDCNQLYFKSYLDQGYNQFFCQLKCGQNEVFRAGRCQCRSGLYLMQSGKCEECPDHSSYSSELKNCTCDKGYIIDQYSRKCEVKCPSNSYVSNGQCKCKQGYNVINGNCQQCPLYSKYNVMNQTCQCLENYRFNIGSRQCELDCRIEQKPVNGKCECVYGLYRIKGRCQQCPKNSKYDDFQNQCKCLSGYKLDQYGRQCIEACVKNQVWINGVCACVPGYYQVSGVCQSCWENSSYDPIQKKCQCNYGYSFNQYRKACELNCRDNQYLFNGQCVCKSNFYLINGYCQQCQQYSVYDRNRKDCICLSGYVQQYGSKDCVVKCSKNEVLNNGLCRCQAGFFNISGKCEKCPQNSKYNDNNKSCDCFKGYYLDYPSYTCIIKCRDNQQLKDGICQCMNGYVFHKDKCIPQPKCPKLSVWNGYQCECLLGYLVNNSCISCNYNQIFNGMECVCLSGYARTYTSQLCSPTEKCSGGQIWTQKFKSCVCPPNTVWILKQCKSIKQCDQKSYWNGQDCVCKSGYYSNNGNCYQNPRPNPRCPANSYFNGVYCCCLPGYFQIRRATCQKCPSQKFWDGQQCSNVNKFSCKSDYFWNYDTDSCQAIGQRCGQNEFWNGLACVCKDSFSKINGVCMKCDAGSFYDGLQCVPGVIQHYCQGSYEVWNGYQCVCNHGFHKIDGRCRNCPEWSNWNGVFCESEFQTSEWCRNIAYSRWNNEKCECMTGYQMNHGVCFN